MISTRPRPASQPRNLHVGLFCPTWPPGEAANGIVTYVKIVRDELLRRGHRVSVFSAACEPSDPEGIVRISSSTRRARWATARHRLGLAPEPLYQFGNLIAQAVLSRHAVDALDVFEMEESFGWCGEVSQRAPMPTVVKLHGPAFLSLIDAKKDSPERLQRTRLEGQALRKAKTIVSPSRSTMESTALRYSLRPEAMKNVPNPIAAVSEALVWQGSAGLAEDILFVGRFDLRKGGDAVLQAFATVAQSRPSARLTFVGPDAGLSIGPGHLQHFADYVGVHLRPEVAARVQFLGSQPAHRIQRLRLECALTVVATRWESFGYVVAEAMSQGCPVVAFDVDGVNELIVHERTGLLVPLGDIDALAAAIGRLLDDRPLAARLGARARSAIVETCGAEAVVGRMLAVYEEAIDRAG